MAASCESSPDCLTGTTWLKLANKHSFGLIFPGKCLEGSEADILVGWDTVICELFALHWKCCGRSFPLQDEPIWTRRVVIRQQPSENKRFIFGVKLNVGCSWKHLDKVVRSISAASFLSDRRPHVTNNPDWWLLLIRPLVRTCRTGAPCSIHCVQALTFSHFWNHLLSVSPRLYFRRSQNISVDQHECSRVWRKQIKTTDALKKKYVNV